MMDDAPSINCPLCESRDVRLFHSYEACNLLICSNCGLIFQDRLKAIDAPSLVSETYDDGWVEMRRKYSQDAFLQHAYFNTLLLEIFCPDKGDLLEIGSGTGEFIYMARNSGWNITGFEPSPQACGYALDKFGITLVNSLWSEDKLKPDDLFDAIVFWHVLEHIQNPLDFLKQVKSHLKQQGLIFFSIPNSRSLTNAIYGFHSPLFKEADHLFHYNSENLRLLLEKESLEIVSLFSREEVHRLESDINAGITLDGMYKDMTFEKAIALMAKLQSEMEGHELFCICKNYRPI